MADRPPMSKYQAEYERDIERHLEEVREQRLRERGYLWRAEEHAVGVHDWTLAPEELYLAGAQAYYQQIQVEHVLDNWAFPGRHDRPPRRLHHKVETRLALALPRRRS